MSRLDYVTIAIVAVCVAALVYLIYMTTNLLGDSGEPDPTEVTPSDEESSTDDTYVFDENDYTEGEADSGTGQEGSAATDDYGDESGYDYQNGEDLDKGSNADGAAEAATEPEDAGDISAADSYNDAREGASSAVSRSGGYLVLAGTFTNKAYAESMEQKLRQLGYTNVAQEPFDRGKYTVVLVDRFGSLSDAKSLVAELKSKGVEAYVKKK